jgi:hypothetical protein
MFRKTVDWNETVAFSTEQSDLLWRTMRTLWTLFRVVAPKPYQATSGATKEAALFFCLVPDLIG